MNCRLKKFIALLLSGSCLADPALARPFMLSAPLRPATVSPAFADEARPLGR